MPTTQVKNIHQCLQIITSAKYAQNLYSLADDIISHLHIMYVEQQSKNMLAAGMHCEM